MDIDFDALTLRELKEMQTRIAKAISAVEQNAKKQALAVLHEKAREHGFSLEELTGTAAPRKRTPSSPKYANPADPSDTWTGRGRKPRWFSEGLAQGMTPEDMAI